MRRSIEYGKLLTSPLNSRLRKTATAAAPRIQAIILGLPHHITHLFSGVFSSSSLRSCLIFLLPSAFSRLVPFPPPSAAAVLRQGEPGDAAPEANAPLSFFVNTPITALWPYSITIQSVYLLYPTVVLQITALNSVVD